MHEQGLPHLLYAEDAQKYVADAITTMNRFSDESW